MFPAKRLRPRAQTPVGRTPRRRRGQAGGGLIPGGWLRASPKPVDTTVLLLLPPVPPGQFRVTMSTSQRPLAGEVSQRSSWTRVPGAGERILPPATCPPVSLSTCPSVPPAGATCQQGGLHRPAGVMTLRPISGAGGGPRRQPPMRSGRRTTRLCRRSWGTSRHRQHRAQTGTSGAVTGPAGVRRDCSDRCAVRDTLSIGCFRAESLNDKLSPPGTPTAFPALGSCMWTVAPAGDST